MNEDSSVEFQPDKKDVVVDNPPETKNVQTSEQIFDISEDNIAPIKEESLPVLGVFPIKKVVQPAAQNPPISTNPTKLEPQKQTPPITSQTTAQITPKETPPPNLTWKIEENTPADKPQDANATKNVLDPNYINPDSVRSTSTPSTPKTIPTLPETPAFKGTLDQKPHLFTPQPLAKPDMVKIKDIPAPQIIKASSQTTHPHTSPITTTPEPIIVQAPKMPLQPAAIQKDKPQSFSPKIPSTNLDKSIGSIPLKDINIPLASTRNVPANPQAKTLGVMPESTDKDGKMPISENPDIKNLRTYESDVAEALARKKTSVASIAIATNKKNNEENPTEPNKKPPETKFSFSKLIIILLSLIFIGIGIAGAYYLYSKSPLVSSTQTPNQSVDQPTTNIVLSDSQVSINIKNLNPSDITARINTELNKPQNPSTIKELVLTNGQRLSGPEMIEIMDIDVPDILKRSLATAWMLGVYADDVGNKDIFIIAKTDFFQNAFAGMLQWENLMADDLKLYLSSPAKGIVNAPLPDSQIQVATTTKNSTSTQSLEPEPSVEPYFTIRGQFEDRIISNKDVRVFRTSQGNILFLYSFINNSTIAFTTKEQTIAKILDRLENQAFIR